MKVIEFGFKNLEVKAVNAFTHYKNEAAVKILEKNKFI